MTRRLAVFASGNGTNAEAIARYANETGHYELAVLVCNKPDAGVLKRMYSLGIPSYLVHADMMNTLWFIKMLRSQSVDAIVLAGFLQLIPISLIGEYQDKIVNIHPSLLPDFGGKGMYGDKVHQAVLDSKEKESGITIHQVSEEYDKGRILFQAKCPVFPGDTTESLASRIHSLEHQHFPVFLAHWLNGKQYNPNV